MTSCRPFACAAAFAAALLSGCEKADPRFSADLARGVSSVMCANDRDDRAMGVILLARSIERFEPQTPYENREIAIDRALREFSKRGCPGRA